MTSQESVERRIRKYVGLEDASNNYDYSNPFLGFVTAFERIVIFGGAIRDLALYDPAHKPADIDVVVDADETALAGFFLRVPHKVNRFGGFRFEYKSQWYDVWCLKNTWALARNYFETHTFDTLLLSTFFNIDAALYSIHERRIYASKAYFEALENRKLDINFEPNPNPEGMAQRALRYAINRNFSFSTRLVEYILENITHFIQTEFGFETQSRLYDHLSSRSSQYCNLPTLHKSIPDVLNDHSSKKKIFPIHKAQLNWIEQHFGKLFC